MICLECRRGGRELPGHLRVVDYGGPTDYAAVGSQEDIENSHAHCRGGTWCDCQHAIEPAVKGRDYSYDGRFGGMKLQRQEHERDVKEVVE